MKGKATMLEGQDAALVDSPGTCSEAVLVEFRAEVTLLTTLGFFVLETGNG